MNRIILVKTCAKYDDRRKVIECTWATIFAEHRVPVFYVKGGYPTTSIPKVEGGIIGLPVKDYVDFNSTKVYHAVKILLSLFPELSHLFVVDDDTFVHPLRWMNHIPSGDLECRLYYPKNKREIKLNGGKPWITGGSGWWMNRKLCELYVAEEPLQVSYDDVLVAKIAQKNCLQITNRPDLYGGDKFTHRLDRVAPDNDYITSHHVTLEEMISLYEDNL